MGVYHPEMPAQEAKAFLLGNVFSHLHDMRIPGGATATHTVATGQVARELLRCCLCCLLCFRLLLAVS